MRYRGKPKTRALACLRAKRYLEIHEYARVAKRKQDIRCGHRRRAVIANAGIYTEQEWEAKLIEFGGACAHCETQEDIQRDHIIPLSRGGVNTIDNLQPLCGHCNASKGNRLEQELSL